MVPFFISYPHLLHKRHPPPSITPPEVRLHPALPRRELRLATYPDPVVVLARLTAGGRRAADYKVEEIVADAIAPRVVSAGREL